MDLIKRIHIDFYRDSADVVYEVKIVYSSYNTDDFEGYGRTLKIAKLDAMYHYLEILETESVK